MRSKNQRLSFLCDKFTDTLFQTKNLPPHLFKIGLLATIYRELVFALPSFIETTTTLLQFCHRLFCRAAYTKPDAQRLVPVVQATQVVAGVTQLNVTRCCLRNYRQRQSKQTMLWAKWCVSYHLSTSKSPQQMLKTLHRMSAPSGLLTLLRKRYPSQSRHVQAKTSDCTSRYVLFLCLVKTLEHWRCGLLPSALQYLEVLWLCRYRHFRRIHLF